MGDALFEIEYILAFKSMIMDYNLRSLVEECFLDKVDSLEPKNIHIDMIHTRNNHFLICYVDDSNDKRLTISYFDLIVYLNSKIEKLKEK